MTTKVLGNRWVKAVVLVMVLVVSFITIGQAGAFWRDGLDIQAVIIPGEEKACEAETAVPPEQSADPVPTLEEPVIITDGSAPSGEENLTIMPDEQDTPVQPDEQGTLVEPDEQDVDVQPTPPEAPVLPDENQVTDSPAGGDSETNLESSVETPPEVKEETVDTGDVEG